MLTSYFSKLSFYCNLVNKFYFILDIIKGFNYSTMSQTEIDSEDLGKAPMNSLHALSKIFMFLYLRKPFVNDLRFMHEMLFMENWDDDLFRDEFYLFLRNDPVDVDSLKFKVVNHKLHIIGKDGEVKYISKSNAEEFLDDNIFVEKEDVKMKLKDMVRQWFIARRRWKDKLSYIKSLRFVKMSRQFNGFFNKYNFKRYCIHLYRQLYQSAFAEESK
jgi:hypothetical protein